MWPSDTIKLVKSWASSRSFLLKSEFQSSWCTTMLSAKLNKLSKWEGDRWSDVRPLHRTRAYPYRETERNEKKCEVRVLLYACKFLCIREHVQYDIITAVFHSTCFGMKLTAENASVLWIPNQIFQLIRNCMIAELVLFLQSTRS